MSEQRWSRRQALLAMVGASASVPLLVQSGCGAEGRYDDERANQWISVSDAFDSTVEANGPGSPTSDSSQPILDRIGIVPRRFVDVASLDCSAAIFERRMFAPIVVGSHRYYADQSGQAAVAEGAREARALAILSDAPSGPARGAWWLALDPGAPLARERLARGRAAGATGLVVSVTPGTVEARLESVRRMTGSSELPLVVSAPVAPTLAAEAVDCGARGVIIAGFVGPRGEPAPAGAWISAVEETVAAAGPGTPVLVSGAFLRGADVLKILGLGARAVVVDRPVAWGLRSAGAPGVRRVIEILQTELAYAMGMSGVPTTGTITRKLVRVNG